MFIRFPRSIYSLLCVEKLDSCEMSLMSDSSRATGRGPKRAVCRSACLVLSSARRCPASRPTHVVLLSVVSPSSPGSFPFV